MSEEKTLPDVQATIFCVEHDSDGESHALRTRGKYIIIAFSEEGDLNNLLANYDSEEELCQALEGAVQEIRVRAKINVVESDDDVPPS